MQGFFAPDRQANRDRGPTPNLAFYADCSLVREYDALTERQPQPNPGACRFGRKERIEDPFQIVRLNAAAIVHHPHQNAPVPLRGACVLRDHTNHPVTILGGVRGVK